VGRVRYGILRPMGVTGGIPNREREQRPAALQSSLLFREADPATLDGLADASRLRHLDRGSVLLLEGSVPTSLYIVVDGLLRVFVTSLDGTEPTLTIMFPGDHVGELGVLHNTPRSASVGAMRATSVLEVPGSIFHAAYRSDGAISRVIVEQLAHRLRQTSSRLCDLTLLDLGARLAKHLVDGLTATPVGTAPFVNLAITQAELGQLIGGARQTINHLLAELEADGIVTVTGRRVEVLDVARLRRRAEMAA
jgi:CRP/FNR family transcriptional regulator, cyclic AMP receptor protein